MKQRTKEVLLWLGVALIFVLCWQLLLGDVKEGYRESILRGSVESWLGLVALQLALWLVCGLRFSVIPPVMNVWELIKGRGQFDPTVFFNRYWQVLAQIAVIAGFLFFSDMAEVPKDRYVEAVWEYAPLKHHDDLIRALYTISAIATLGVLVALARIRVGFDEVDGNGSLTEIVSQLSPGRIRARQIVTWMGGLVALAMIATGVLRGVINQRIAAVAHLPLEKLKQSELLATEPVMLYGSALTLFLFAVYWPVHQAGRAAAERAVDSLCPVAGQVDAIPDNVKQRQALQSLLGSKDSPAEVVQSAVGVIAPFLAALSSLTLSQ